MFKIKNFAIDEKGIGIWMRESVLWTWTKRKKKSRAFSLRKQAFCQVQNMYGFFLYLNIQLKFIIIAETLVEAYSGDP